MINQKKHYFKNTLSRWKIANFILMAIVVLMAIIPFGSFFGSNDFLGLRHLFDNDSLIHRARTFVVAYNYLILVVPIVLSFYFAYRLLSNPMQSKAGNVILILAYEAISIILLAILYTNKISLDSASDNILLKTFGFVILMLLNTLLWIIKYSQFKKTNPTYAKQYRFIGISLIFLWMLIIVGLVVLKQLLASAASIDDIFANNLYFNELKNLFSAGNKLGMAYTVLLVATATLMFLFYIMALFGGYAASVYRKEVLKNAFIFSFINLVFLLIWSFSAISKINLYDGEFVKNKVNHYIYIVVAIVYLLLIVGYGLINLNKKYKNLAANVKAFVYLAIMLVMFMIAIVVKIVNQQTFVDHIMMINITTAIIILVIVNKFLNRAYKANTFTMAVVLIMLSFAIGLNTTNDLLVYNGNAAINSIPLYIHIYDLFIIFASIAILLNIICQSLRWIYSAYIVYKNSNKGVIYENKTK
ncbi:MSC_0624 family F1-like ATPase-associated membrane protein [Metamycoplasma neophronis]|uniref:Uncharacterized protein n=1 Tax=Metamycoplasma neophronis TaxID=872983 RepID=A0ABY2Z243_9BACT|nr:hypothetical protein [Metamycoplasma neophronis]TPR54065.1 hypothetical protein FJR74_01320 [Metamycoplasma neophronis]